MIDVLTQLNFIRPWWLLVIAPVLVLLVFFYRFAKNYNQWNKVIDSRLLNYLMPNYKAQKAHKSLFSMLTLISVLAILALSGPSFWQQKTPIYALDKLQIILLDASVATLSTDVKPSRFERSLLLIRQLLKQQQEGQTMLIAFSGEPFVISPPTSDNKPILNLLDGLSPSTLPVSGFRLDLALSFTEQQLKKHPNKQVDILLLTGTDKVDSKSLTLAQTLANAGHHLSIIGVASDKRVPILNDKGLLKNKDGSAVLTGINQRLLSLLANKGGGLYQLLDNDVENIKRYVTFSKVRLINAQATKQQQKSVQWVDFGWYLSLMLLPLVWLLFKRGLLLILLIGFFITQPQPTYATPTLSLLDTMWQTRNKQAQNLYKQQQYQKAAQLFDNLSWQANANYRAEQFEAAADLYQQLGQYYNYGNSLAAQGEYKKAIESYKQVQEQHLNYTNAQYNLKVIERLLQQQKQQQQNQQRQQQDQQQDKQQKKQKQQTNQNSKDDKNKKSQAENKPDKQNQQQKSNSEDKKSKKDAKEQQQSVAEDKQDKKSKEQQAQATNSEQNKKDKEQQIKKQLRQEQVNRQKLKQYFGKVKTRPVDLLKQKLLIEHQKRIKQKSKFSNKQ